MHYRSSVDGKLAEIRREFASNSFSAVLPTEISMFILPKNVSHGVRAALQPNLAEQNMKDALQGVTAAVMRLFGAEQAALVFDSADVEDRLFALEAREASFDVAVAEQFFQRWFDDGLHERVKRDLIGRLASISYSAFSWPYGILELEQALQEPADFVIPRDYTIFLPISSCLLVRDEMGNFLAM